MSCGFFKKKFSTNKISSLYFMAPERIQGELEKDDVKIQKTDMWSLGVIIYMIVFGSPPFEGSTTSALVKQIKKAQISKLDNSRSNDGENFDAFKDLMSLVSQLLTPQTYDRIDAIKAMNHPFMTNKSREFRKMKLRKQAVKDLNYFW